MRTVLVLSPLLLLAACAEPAGIAPGSAPIAVDLGSSSRVSHIAGHAGEGEGYDAFRPPSQPTAPQAATVKTATGAPRAPTPATVESPIDHSKMDHSRMDHSNMDHGGTTPSPGARP